MPATATPRLLSILALLATVVGGVSAVVVLPSVWLFLTGASSMSDIAKNPLAVIGLLILAPALLVAAPLAFAFAVRRGHRAALSLGLVWWSLVIAVVAAATLPVVGQVEPVTLIGPIAIVAGGIAALAYFWRLRTTFGATTAPAARPTPVRPSEPPPPAISLLRPTDTIRRRSARQKRRR